MNQIRHCGSAGIFVALSLVFVCPGVLAQATPSTQDNSPSALPAPKTAPEQASKHDEKNSDAKSQDKDKDRRQADQQNSSPAPAFYVYGLKAPTSDSTTLSPPISTSTSAGGNADLTFKGAAVTNSSKIEYLVQGHLLHPGEKIELESDTTTGFASGLLGGNGCIAGKSLSNMAIGTSPPKSNLQPNGVNKFSPRDNNIFVSEPKAVDPQFLKQKFAQAAQALAGLNPWSSTALTNQYGVLQGSSNSNSFFSAQLTTAGQPGVQSTTATGQPSTVVANYTANCPTGYVVTGITAGNGVTCAAPSIAGTSGQGSLATSQTTTPTPSVQTQVSAPAFGASIPAQPTAVGALSPPSNIGLSPVDVLTQEVELHSELLTFQTLYSGIASDNSQISANGAVGSARPQVTLAFPITIKPYAPYPGAVAEVRIFMLPGRNAEIETENQKAQGPKMSLVNLLPASNTYNVAQATTSTKQFGAGVTFSLIGVGVNGGKTKSALYLAKDTDTIALEYSNPAEARDNDAKKPLLATFRNMLPMGECDATRENAWEEDATLASDKEPYDTQRAIIFGWQFKPVLGNQDIQPINRLFYAQVALDNTKNALAPAIFVETRWRQYNRKTGVVGEIYKDSCSWQYLGNASPLQYQTEVAYVTTNDLGGGNVQVVANGRFTDPNFQIRMGNLQKLPDATNNSLTEFEFFTTAAALVSAPTLEVLSEGKDPVPVVTIPSSDQCQMDSVTAHATPYSDGTAMVTLDMNYGANRTVPDESPLVLAGGTVYGLQDHPFLSPDGDVSANPRRVQFIEKMDALTASPVVVVKDVNWSQISLSARVDIGPTFSSVQALPIDPSASNGGTTPGSGAAGGGAVGTTVAGGPNTTAADKVVPLTAGLYQLTGTAFRSFCKSDGTCEPSSLAYVNASTGAATALKPTELQIINDQTARLTVDGDITKAVPNWPIVLEWTDSSGVKSDWSLSTKVNSQSSTAITADKQPKRHDSVSVVFSGQDFSGVSGVAFENTNLTIMAKSTKSITVLVTTGVTATIGTKDLIATGADGKPIILPVTVIAQ